MMTSEMATMFIGKYKKIIIFNIPVSKCGIMIPYFGCFKLPSLPVTFSQLVTFFSAQELFTL